MYFYECNIEFYDIDNAVKTERALVAANNYGEAGDYIEDYYGDCLIAFSIMGTEHEGLYPFNEDSFRWTAPQYKEKKNV